MLHLCKFTSLMPVCLPSSGIFFYCVRTRTSWDITASLATNLYLRNKLNVSLIWSPPDDLGNWKDLPGEVGVLCSWLLWVSPSQGTLGLKEILLSQELCAPPTCNEPLWGPVGTPGKEGLAGAAGLYLLFPVPCLGQAWSRSSVFPPHQIFGCHKMVME